MPAPPLPSPRPKAPPAAEWTGHPLWGLGFRPFFLLSALAAIVLLGAWLAVLYGRLPPPGIDPLTWHGHEMVYGFAVAMVAGFLLTASQNWTGKRGVHGRRLQALAALWLAGRVAMWVYPPPRAAGALVDLAFLPLLAALLWPYLGDASQRRNRVFLAYLGVLWAGNLMVHADLLGLWPGAARNGLWLGVYGLLLVLVLVGGRVIPNFTRGAIPGAAVRVRPWVERLSQGSALALAATAFLPPEGAVARMVALAAAGIHGVRLAGWFVRPVLRRPIVLILHVGYGWVVTGFALLALAPWLGLPPADALHAFTVGGIGVLIYGMISRIALGHTGRPIHAAPQVVAGYALINAAALARIAGPFFGAPGFNLSLQLAGSCWMLAFALFLAHYAPMLVRPRQVD